MKENNMKSIGDILQKFNPKEDKYVSREFQTFGVFLAEKLHDERKKALYIKYSKYIPRPILEQAYRFVIDSKARNKAALFMWKLRELGVFEKYKVPGPVRKKKTEEEKKAAEQEKAAKKALKEQKKELALTQPKKRGRKKQSLDEPFGF